MTNKPAEIRTMTTTNRVIIIHQPRGAFDSIAHDLDHADFKHSEHCEIEYDTDEYKVTIRADHDTALCQLHDWLEETALHYKENFVDAAAEYRSARQMAEIVYETFQHPDWSKPADFGGGDG